MLFAPVLAVADDLKLEDAIRQAWAANPGLSAASLQAQASKKQAGSAEAGRLPSVALSARGVGTGEPMMAFGLRLDQQRIAAVDLSPDRLNAPPFTGGVGLGATLTQPIYAGGRIEAGIRAARAQADADGRTLERRRDEMALAVTEAYFGSLAAAQGLAYADDVLAHARETERFVKDRNAKGVVLDADVARAAAFRAQAEADRATAEQRLASARSALALLSGEPARSAALVTPDRGGAGAGGIRRRRRPGPTSAPPGRGPTPRGRRRRGAGSLLPQVFAQASVETMRSADRPGRDVVHDVSSRGGSSRSATCARRSPLRRARGRRRRGRAGRSSRRERGRGGAARRRGRRREGPLGRRGGHRLRVRPDAPRDPPPRRSPPLTDVLDADAALAGARALLLGSRFEARLARARLQLALGRPVEGVKP